ncbi:ATP-dependent DNA ligase [Paenibacillus sp. J31TS4]|uniref:ATP-dependent DNA ligase n=1 Tax=Paenibacillus sp. J31TS4 TaxID=2807195 RepID=UPI001AFF8CEE|nr:DNA ligase [Paenibacillus sp. J31TS4]GIP37652.1 ATP-dependent DNA ligase [Paenibacillus sp. J31TS4]
MKPFLPMSPILTDTLPEGDEWTYQLKWDGFRIIACVQDGTVRLFSKAMQPKTDTYPELAAALSRCRGSFVLDGEAVLLDPETGRPSFQRMQQRDKLKQRSAIARAAERSPVQYVLFDVLEWESRSLWTTGYEERDALLRGLFPEREESIWLADRFEDGQALWTWVEANGWEGVIAKRRDSLYTEGKEHNDWYKRKTVQRFEVEAVGVTIREGRLASLVMSREGRFFGKVSSGLNGRLKERLLALPLSAPGAKSPYFAELPVELRPVTVRWLKEPIPCLVTGQETTERHLLRHPKLLTIGGEAP